MATKKTEETVAEEVVTMTQEQLKAMIDEAVAEKLKEKEQEEPHYGGKAFMPEGPKTMVKVKLFRDNDRYKDPVFVAVNGERYIVPRGVEVEIPEYIYEVLERSMAEDQQTALMLERLENKFNEKTKEIG